MEPGRERERLEHSAASNLGRIDPVAAISWIQTRSPVPLPLLESILRGVAEVDFDQAIEVVTALPPGVDRDRIQDTVLMSSAVNSIEGALSAANFIMANETDSERIAESVYRLTSVWSMADAESAVDWLLVNNVEVDNRTFRTIGERLGEQNGSLAASYTARIPEGARPDWVAAVGEGYAKANPADALAWVTPFAGDSRYDGGVAVVAEQLAANNARAAASLLDLVQSDTAAAISATAATAGALAAEDYSLATSWALNMPPGARRDASLVMLVSASDTGGTPEPALFDAIQSERAKQQAMFVSIASIARRDRAAAEVLLEEQLTDPSLRAQAELILNGTILDLP
jgi:hypothetical protein